MGSEIEAATLDISGDLGSCDCLRDPQKHIRQKARSIPVAIPGKKPASTAMGGNLLQCAVTAEAFAEPGAAAQVGVFEVPPTEVVGEGDKGEEVEVSIDVGVEAELDLAAEVSRTQSLRWQR